MSAQPCTIYLVRHGETEWNKIGRMQGHTDIPLNSSGISQAHDLRKILDPIDFYAVYASDLKRALDTARILIHNKNIKIQRDKDLRERSFGMYEGKPSVETWNELRPVLDMYDDTHPLIANNNVETNNQMRKRVIQSLLSIAEKNKGKCILVVAHHGVMKQLLLHIGYSQPHQFPKGSIRNLAYIKLSIHNKVVKVEGIHGITLLN